MCVCVCVWCVCVCVRERERERDRERKREREQERRLAELSHWNFLISKMDANVPVVCGYMGCFEIV